MPRDRRAKVHVIEMQILSGAVAPPRDVKGWQGATANED